ncbi:hypothetical protein BSY15_436 [Acidovorax sp. RAC01]|nr:hypothetical protein BSY15_436 [Acidovorax sp. RAC01]
MPIRCWTFAVLLSLTGIAVAQPAPKADAPAACAADKADLEKRIAEAQAKGRMLLRRELAAQLAALEAGCKPLDAHQSRTARIARLEKEVTALRAELAEAEGQLRALKEAVGR